MNPVKWLGAKYKSQSVEELALIQSSFSEVQWILSEVPVLLITFAVILTLLTRE